MGLYSSPSPWESFQALSFSSHQFRWVECESWQRAHIEFFADHRALDGSTLLSPPPFATRPQARILARWVLDQHADDPIGWAEAIGYDRRFRSVDLALGQREDWRWNDNHDSGNHDHGNHDSGNHDPEYALAILIAGLAIVADADRIRIHNAAMPDWGERVQLWSPCVDALSRPDGAIGKFVATTEVQISDWWETEIGREARKAMSYLTKAIRPRVLRTRPRRASLLGKLFGRK